jgi:hypothetical protein
VITIKKLFDDWKDVLSRYANITFLHSFYILLFYLFTFLSFQASCKYRAKQKMSGICHPTDTARVQAVY